MKNSVNQFSACVIVVAMVLIAPLYVSAAESERVLEEIVVTATKKSTAESAQDVPIAVAAFNGETLEAAQMVQISDIQAWVPNVQLERHTTVPNGTSFSIRGLGTGSSIPSDDPPVGVFMDGVVMGILHGSNLDVFDLESIEVLRGPQGTLFGRNVSAGAIVARTARPSFELGGDVRLTAGSNGRQDASFRVTGPLVDDKLAGKLTVMYRSHDGYYDNTFVPGVDGVQVTSLYGENLSLDSDYGEDESYIIRPSLRFTPTDEVTIDIIAEFGSAEGDGMAWRAVYAPFGGRLPDGDQDVVAQHNGRTDNEHAGVVVDVNWQTENGVWTSISAWREHETSVIFDTEGTGASIFDFLINPDQDQISQEIRWAGTPFENDVQLTVGAYYFSQDVVYREGRVIFGFINQGLGGDIEHDAWAVFSQISWPVNEKLTIDAGLRYTDEEKETQQVLGPGCDITTFICNFNFFGDDDWSNVTPSLSATYAVNDDVMIWGSYKKGFRSGGFNLRHSNPAFSPVYDEEEVDAFEIGIKADINRVLRINASVWHNTYDDQQVVRLNDDASQSTVNAAKSTATGLDLELSWLATDHFSISANLGVFDSEVDEMDPGVLAAVNASRAVTNVARIDDPTATPGLPPILDESDLELGFPTETAGVTLRWNYPLPNGASIELTGIASYVGDWESGSNVFTFDSTTMINTHLTYTSASQRWRVTVFGENVTDEEYILGFIETSLGIAAPTGPGSRWAAQFSYEF